MSSSEAALDLVRDIPAVESVGSIRLNIPTDFLRGHVRVLGPVGQANLMEEK